MDEIHEGYFPPEKVGSMSLVEKILVIALGGTFLASLSIWFRLNAIENKYGKWALIINFMSFSVTSIVEESISEDLEGS